MLKGQRPDVGFFFVVARFVRGHDPGSPPPNGAAAASEASNPNRTGALSLDHCLFTETGDPSSGSSAQNVALDWVRCDPPLLFTSAGLRQQAWQFLEKMSPLVTTEQRRARPRAGWYFRHPESRLEFRHLPSRDNP